MCNAGSLSSEDNERIQYCPLPVTVDALRSSPLDGQERSSVPLLGTDCVVPSQIRFDDGLSLFLLVPSDDPSSPTRKRTKGPSHSYTCADDDLNVVQLQRFWSGVRHFPAKCLTFHSRHNVTNPLRSWCSYQRHRNNLTRRCWWCWYGYRASWKGEWWFWTVFLGRVVELDGPRPSSICCQSVVCEVAVLHSLHLVTAKASRQQAPANMSYRSVRGHLARRHGPG